MQNNGSQIRLAMVSNLGKTQVYNRHMQSFTLENMLVDKIIFCSTAWVGFLGHRRPMNVSSTTPSENYQYLEIFSQKNLGVCLHTIKVE